MEDEESLVWERAGRKVLAVLVVSIILIILYILIMGEPTTPIVY